MNLHQADPAGSAQKPLRILHLEDSFRDAEIIRERLIDAGFFIQVDRAANEKAFQTFLKNGGYDLIFIDYYLPGYDGLSGLKLTKTLCPEVPAIFISGMIGEDMAVEILKQGATDYVLKNRLNKLPLAISRALEEKRERRAHRLAMETLHESEKRYRCLFENMLNGCAFCQMLYEDGKPQDFIYLAVNRAFESLTGLKDVIGRKVTDLIPGIQNTDLQLLERYSRVATSGQPERFEIYLESMLKWFDVSVYSPERGYFVAVFDVITDRKQAEAQMRQLLEAVALEKDRLSALVNSISDEIWFSDLAGKFTLVNPSGIQEFALDDAGAIDVRNLAAGLEVLRPDGSPRPIEETPPLRALTGEVVIKQEEMIRTPATGQIRHRQVSASPVRNTWGHIIGSVSVVRDITDQKCIEAERRQWELKQQQVQKAESIQRMAGAIAHHFNNHLHVIIGNLDIVINDLPLGSDNCERLVNALKSSHAASHISQMMLTYLGKTPGNLASQDLSEACHKGLLMVQSLIPDNVSVVPELSFPGPTVQGNLNQLIQILTHLLTNAWESISTDPGTITLSVTTVSSADIPAAPRFPLSWQPQDGLYACLKIADTGCGLASEEIDKIFDPFFTTKFIGRGLGLSVVLGILETHDGGITVESASGRGSTFRVFLPISSEAVSISYEKAEQPVEVPAEISGGTVLLVDDESLVRSMVKTMLTRLGYTVLEASDGVMAVEMFQQHPNRICCVLCDLTMPRMNGWNTLSALRKISPDIPVILTSGYDEAQVMADEHPDHPDAFLGKPYQLNELKKTLNRVIQGHLTQLSAKT
jgi:PAS domain S-box-containing protein